MPGRLNRAPAHIRLEDLNALIDLEHIPPHRRRPLRFSLRLVVLCYALSLGAHAGMLGWLINTPIEPAPPYAGRASDMPDGQRRPVAVTITMKMSDFAQAGQSQPSNRPDPPTAPQTAEPASASGQPQTLNPQPDPPAHTQTTPQGKSESLTADSPEPRIETNGLPDHDQLAGHTPPGPRPADPPSSTSTPNTTSKPVTLDLEAIARQTDELLDNVLPTIEKLIERLPKGAIASKAQHDQPNAPTAASAEVTEQVQAKEQAQASTEPEPAEQTPEPAPTNEPPAVASTDAPANDAGNRDDRPAAIVYDQDSVDQAITFKSKTRPKQSSVSKRLGDRGTIKILIEVDAGGKLVRYEVIDDADQPRLLAAAIKALESSTFHPATREGKPVRSTWGLEYRF